MKDQLPKDGETCPHCQKKGGLDDADDGGIKCRFCGWKSEK